MKITLDMIQDAIETANDSADSIDAFKSCFICLYDSETAPEIRISLVETNEYKSAQGIHIVGADSSSDLQFRLSDAIHQCHRDGFHNVWIHSN